MQAPVPPTALPASRQRAARYRNALVEHPDNDLFSPVDERFGSVETGQPSTTNMNYLVEESTAVDQETEEEVGDEESLHVGLKRGKGFLKQIFERPRKWLKLLSLSSSGWSRAETNAQDRVVFLNDQNKTKVKSPNAVRNQQYTLLNFLPKILFEEFRMFYNLFFLLVALSQLIPPLRVNYLFTYLGPLLFVLTVSISKKLYDDWQRYLRDREVNLQKYLRLSKDGQYLIIDRKDIHVGDILLLQSDDRVPADCLLLKTVRESKGTIFIRTDQLDGETDWKLRRAISCTQSVQEDEQMQLLNAYVRIEPPKREIYDFVGNFYLGEPEEQQQNHQEEQKYVEEPLSLENILWANTVIASGSAFVLVIYTGKETRSSLNASKPKSKIGKLDWELNRISKMLFLLLGSMAGILILLKGFQGRWYLYFMRYFLLFSSVIPISMRINLDMARTIYSYFIQHDKDIPGCIVRSSNLPEEQGRIDYLLSDKTGTLTKNEMQMKKLHVGSTLFSKDDMEEIRNYALWGFSERTEMYHQQEILTRDPPFTTSSSATAYSRSFRQVKSALYQSLLGIAIAHHVTPFIEEDGSRRIQAASPDEVALVNFCEECGVLLLERTSSWIRLQTPEGREEQFEILCEFPFTSASRRMGIVVRDIQTNEIVFYIKGADMVVSQLVHENDWLEEESGNLAREGLRTLVYARRKLDAEEFEKFMKEYQSAQRSIRNRAEAINMAQRSIERDMELLALTGVEDKLQDGVRETIEKLQHAGIRIWMLTGDKVETATNIAISSRLVQRSKGVFTITGVSSRLEASRQLAMYRHRVGDVLIVDGPSLQTLLTFCREDFLQLSCQAPSVVVCRCSPTQKSLVVRLVQLFTSCRVAAIGDGGNDVSMIQQADFGIGIPGKEGKQASLASDVSIVQFSHLIPLLLWHGRNSYKRSARLAQFVIHRGLIIAIIQMVYCAIFFYAAVPIFEGWILVGYATIYTMFPVFSLILDVDVTKEIAYTYPELYADLRKGRSLNLKTFLTWVLKSLYQGMTIMVVSVYVLWNDDYFSTSGMTSVAFTSLILTELIMVAVEIRQWHVLMVLAECFSLLSYGISLFLLQSIFDMHQILHWSFWLRILIVTCVSCFPIVIAKFINRKCVPPSYSKLI